MMDQPKRPAGSIFIETTNVLAAIAFRVDVRIKDMFEEAFNAGQNFEEWGEPYPDFETWFAAAVERWRNA